MLPIKAAAQEAPPAEPEGGEEEYYEEGYYEEGYYEEEAAEEVDYTQPFPAEVPMEPNARMLAGIPLMILYPGVLACAAAAGLAGASVGRGFPVAPSQRDVVAYSVAAVAAGAVIAGGVQAKKVRDRAAVIDLFNQLVYMEDPTDLTKDDVKAVGNKYGINMHKEQLEGLQQIFGQYLEHTIPSGDQQLRGDEAPKVVAFKDALGLSDEEAAPVFIEVGRRLSARGFEMKDRQAQFEQRKAFQRLIYVSYSVFGDQKAAFLLPWRRVFNLNDSQLFVARRDNARAIFEEHLKEKFNGDLPADRNALRELRDYQASVRLMDSVAEESVRAAARAHIEKLLSAAVEVQRSPAKSRDPARIVEELGSMLDYSRKLERLANDDDLVPGVARPSLQGGDWAGDVKRRDIRDVYRTYAEERVEREGAFTLQLDSDLKELSSMLCMGAKEAADVRAEVAAGLYRRLLKEEVASRRIDEAESPAKVLGELVQKSGFSPEAAMEMHKALYRQKITQLVSKKKLTEQDSRDLQRIRRILCITQDVANEIMKSSAGHVLDEVLAEVFQGGPRPMTGFDLERVDGTIKDIKMDREVAKAVFAEAARKQLKAFAGQAVKDLQRDRKAAAIGLKKMVQFNSLVVSPLLQRVSGAKDMEAAKKELAELMAKAAEEAKKEEAKKKAEAAAAGATEAKEEKKEEEAALPAAKDMEAAKKELAELMAKAAEEAKKEEEKEAEPAPAPEAAAAEAKAAEAKPAEKEGEDGVFDLQAMMAKMQEQQAKAKEEGEKKEEKKKEEEKEEEEKKEFDLKAALEAAQKQQEAAKEGGIEEEKGSDDDEAAAKAKAEAEAKAKAEEEAMKKAEEEAKKKAAEEKDPVFQVRKMMAASRGEFGEEEKNAQKEINIGNDVDKAVRADLYKTYLMYSMSGDVVELPVGGVIRKKTDAQSRQQEMVRLQQLGDILGMSQFEVASVHQDLSEQAFKNQAQEVLRGPGALSPQTTGYLEDMRKQLQLPEDKAQKIIREVRTEVLGASAALEEAGGQKWTVERVLEAHKEGVDVKKALEEPARRTLLRREMDKRLGDGKAEFDAKLLLVELPQILGVEQKRVDALLRELVGSRKRMLLVQAISQHRQKRSGDAVTSLSNLISAYRATPDAAGVGAVQWGEKEELKELFATYCAKVDDDAKRDELATLFGIPESEREEVRRTAGAAIEKAKQQQREEEELFF